MPDDPTWRFRGSPHYIDQQGDRLGVSKILTDRVRHNSEMYRVSVLVGQLCERYHRARNGDLIRGYEWDQIRNTLGQCEQEVEKLHVLAAAAQAIVDEATGAFGLDLRARGFRVVVDSGDNQESLPMPDHVYVIRVKLPSSSAYHGSPSGDGDYQDDYDRAIQDAMPSGFGVVKQKPNEKWAVDSEGRSMVVIRPFELNLTITAYVEEAKLLRNKIETIKKIIG